MNSYLQLSLDYASQRSYLDDLFRVYPTLPNGLREIDEKLWQRVEQAFDTKDNQALIQTLLKFETFPIKDGYVAFLRKMPKALVLNPRTVNRLSGRIYELGLSELYKHCSVPKETNRQMEPCFRNWVKSGALGIFPIPLKAFLSSKDDAILDEGDAGMQRFAREHLHYQRSKGLDFVARFHGKYIIGEAKFLTDFGGHQNAQFNDAISTLTASNVHAVKVAILDGVLYIPNQGKLYRELTSSLQNQNIMSALVLREFLHAL